MILAIAAVGVLFCCIGIRQIDTPENFKGLEQKHEPLKMKDMFDVLKHNKPLQYYIWSAASDKIAQQAASQAVIGTLLSGIIIGNIGLATIISAVGMFPSIAFAIVGAKYAGKHGSRDSILHWTVMCIIFACATVVFFCVIDPKKIGVMFSWQMIVYVILTFLLNGAKMAVTTSNSSFMADTIDFELERSGKYIPAVVSGTYSLIDKLVSAFSAVIATGACALVGYTNTLPQPGDATSPAIFWVTMTIVYGLPLIGWFITLAAMGRCKLSKEEMVNVQKNIAERKAALKASAEEA
jgi:GPH family glycoside/pentoside/hexuronide:cation symporter